MFTNSFTNEAVPFFVVGLLVGFLFKQNEQYMENTHKTKPR